MAYRAAVGEVHVLGSLNVDHPVTVVRHPAVGETVRGEVRDTTPGGKGLNQAVAAALAMADGLADGMAAGSVHLHGTVGADDAGRWLVEFSAGCGVVVDRVQVDVRRRTGSAWITVAEDGANTVIVDPGANDATTFDAGDVTLSPGDVVVAQLEVPVDAVAGLLAAASRGGAVSMFNPSPVGMGTELAASCTILVVNEHELAELCGVAIPGTAVDPQAVVELAGELRRGDQTVVVTLGAAGAVAVGPWGVDVIPGVAVRAVDSTGAGDCFLGVLAASLAGGAALRGALRRANRVAARSVTRPGVAIAMRQAFELARDEPGPRPEQPSR